MKVHENPLGAICARKLYILAKEEKMKLMMQGQDADYLIKSDQRSVSQSKNMVCGGHAGCAQKTNWKGF